MKEKEKTNLQFYDRQKFVAQNFNHFKIKIFSAGLCLVVKI